MIALAFGKIFGLITSSYCSHHIFPTSLFTKKSRTWCQNSCWGIRRNKIFWITREQTWLPFLCTCPSHEETKPLVPLSDRYTIKLSNKKTQNSLGWFITSQTHTHTHLAAQKRRWLCFKTEPLLLTKIRYITFYEWPSCLAP